MCWIQLSTETYGPLQKTKVSVLLRRNVLELLNLYTVLLFFFVIALLDAHRQWGNKWAKIAGILPGRTQLHVRDRWRLLCGVRRKRTADGAPTGGISPLATARPAGNKPHWTEEEDQSKSLLDLAPELRLIPLPPPYPASLALHSHTQFC
jgi:hypothetical protein